MQIIFIEGVSGVGKTMLSQKISDRLCGMGFSTECFLEFDFTNPIDFYCTAYFKQDEYNNLLATFPDSSDAIRVQTIVAKDIRLIRYYDGETALFPEPLLNLLSKHEFCYKPAATVPLPEYTRVYKLVWEMFTLKTKNHPDFLIFDGSLLHHPINDLMQNYNATCDQIAFHVNTLAKTVNPLNPRVIYLWVDNIDERLHKAHICRKQMLPSKEKILFWEERKQMDLAVLNQLIMPYDFYDISQENWDYMLDAILVHILETDKERRARIYPVILSEYNPAWPEWFTEEKANLERLIGSENIVRLNHYGSTSVPGLVAKPTVDILLEIKEETDINKLIDALSSPEYICLNPPDMPTPPPYLMFLKGYTSNGFAEKVYHIHVRYPRDCANHDEIWDELHFRDYLIAHPDTAAKYATLKRKLHKEYEYDRDGYTLAKTEFIREVTEKSREEVTR